MLQELLRNRDKKKDSELAKRTGISPDRIERLASDAEPTLEEIRLFAGFFRVDLRDLLPLNPRHQSFGLLFRSSGKNVDEVTSAALSRRIGYSVELLGDRRAKFSDWTQDFVKGNLSYQTAEDNAAVFRKLFVSDDQIGPLFRLPELAPEALGILIFLVPTQRFEGASAYISGLPFVFLKKTFGPRMLFTLAHEIGHLIAHHDPERGFAIVDAQTESRPQASKNADEFYAHAFASCLLMPRQGIGIALRKIREMQDQSNKELGDLEVLLLARIYGVSFYTAARRCEDLELLPKGGAASLNESLTKEFGSPEKRAEAANLPPRPESIFPQMPAPLLNAALGKVRSGEISVGKASSILGLSIADLLAVNAPRAH